MKSRHAGGPETVFGKFGTFTAMSRKKKGGPCVECGRKVSSLPTTVEYRGQEVHLFGPVTCADCLLELCEKYSTACANCGGPIPPFSHVGVLKGDRGERRLVHMSAACSTVGGAFHGYWGKGELSRFLEIEAC